MGRALVLVGLLTLVGSCAPPPCACECQGTFTSPSGWVAECARACITFCRKATQA